MKSIKLRVWGDFACFTRPENKAERLSYEAPTPSAARGLLEAIHWKPAMRWVVDRIHVLKPIQFQSLRKSEVSDKLTPTAAEQGWRHSDPSLTQYDVSHRKHRQQRAMQALKDVDYVIGAHIELTGKSEEDTVDKHLNMFRRRARRGACFQRPFLGLREFAADFELIDDEIPVSALKGERELGLMLYDLDYEAGVTPIFYEALMSDGVIDVARARQEGLLS